MTLERLLVELSAIAYRNWLREASYQNRLAQLDRCHIIRLLSALLRQVAII